MLTLFFSIILGCSNPTENTTTPPPKAELRQVVRVETVTTQTLSQNLVLPTTLEAEQSAILVPKVQGRIANVFVRIGDQVPKGAHLLEIEPNDYSAAYEESKMAMRLAAFKWNNQSSISEDLKNF